MKFRQNPLFYYFNLVGFGSLFRGMEACNPENPNSNSSDRDFQLLEDITEQKFCERMVSLPWTELYCLK